MLRRNELVSEVKQILLDNFYDYRDSPGYVEGVAEDVVKRILELIQK